MPNIKLDLIKPLRVFRHKKELWLRTRTPMAVGNNDGYYCVSLTGSYPGGVLWIDKNTAVAPGTVISWEDIADA